MVSSRKRGREQLEAVEAPEAPKEMTLIQRIRNMWEFANLSQWIFTFGKAVKIEETWSDIEVCKLHAAWTRPLSLSLSLMPSILIQIGTRDGMPEK
jgi:hypothetical protein